jgi:hypothetical protein
VDVSLAELAQLIRHVDQHPEDEGAITRLRDQLRASSSAELMRALSMAQRLKG